MKVRIHILAAIIIMAMVTPAAAQVGITDYADSQIVAAYDSAKANGFPQGLLACVYGRGLNDSTLVIDSITVVPGDCETDQLIGLIGFVPASEVVGDKQEAWMQRFARMLREAPGSRIFGVIYGVGTDPANPKRRVPYALADYQ